MKTLLVTTDFSKNSKAGIRLAIHATKLADINLRFLYVSPLIAKAGNPPKKDKTAYKDLSLKLKRFVTDVYHEMELVPPEHDCIVVDGVNADSSILHYCEDRPEISYICISTTGAGGIAKFLGTITSRLIAKSPVPVLIVPANYQPQPINLLLYATDFKNYLEEVKLVVSFAELFNAKVEAWHLIPMESRAPDEEKISSLKKAVDYKVDIHIKEIDVLLPIADHLKNQIELQKPAVLVMFTNQQRSPFEKIFLSSLSEDLAFEPTIPILVFNKYETEDEE